MLPYAIRAKRSDDTPPLLPHYDMPATTAYCWCHWCRHCSWDAIRLIISHCFITLWRCSTYSSLMRHADTLLLTPLLLTLRYHYATAAERLRHVFAIIFHIITHYAIIAYIDYFRYYYADATATFITLRADGYDYCLRHMVADYCHITPRLLITFLNATPAIWLRHWYIIRYAIAFFCFEALHGFTQHGGYAVAPPLYYADAIELRHTELLPLLRAISLLPPLRYYYWYCYYFAADCFAAAGCCCMPLFTLLRYLRWLLIRLITYAYAAYAIAIIIAHTIRYWYLRLRCRLRFDSW